MKAITPLAILSLIIASLFSSACSGDSSNAQEKGDEVQVASAADPSTGSEGGTAGTVEQTESARAYTELISKLQTMQKTAKDPEQQADVFAAAEKGFKEFIDQYPGTEEAADAKFQLGIVYVTTAKPKTAIKYFEQFLEDDRESDKASYAMFYLAKSHQDLDNFTEAKKYYNTFLNEFPDANRQFTAVAKSSLEDMETLKRLSIGSEPIPFEVTDLQGHKLSLEKYKGKVVLLDFWATWCGPCKIEMPNVIKLHKKYNKDGFEIIGISLDRDENALRNYVKSHQMVWPQHFDGRGWQNAVAMKYKVRSIPATYLIDRDGKIRYRSIRGPQLEAAVEKLLKETS